MFIGTNLLLKWMVVGNQIRFFWPDGTQLSLSFNQENQVDALLNGLERISHLPETREQLIADLKSQTFPDAGEIVNTLLSKQVLRQADGGTAAEAKTYHAFTESQPLRGDLEVEEQIRLVCDAFWDELPASVALPEPDAPTELSGLFCGGRTSYEFDQKPVTALTLSTLLALAHGRHGFLEDGRDNLDVRGTTGSAGGFYPLKLVISTQKTLSGPSPFCWTYIRSEHALARIDVDANSAKELEAINKHFSVYGFHLLITIMMDLKWSELKYGNHAYRFAMLEAGAVMQNIRIVSRRLGLENCPIGIPLGNDFDAILPSNGNLLHALTIGLSTSADRSD